MVLYIILIFFPYSTCRFSQLFDLLMSLRQIFCKISLAKFSDMCVRELRIFMALWAAAFLSRVSFKRIYTYGLADGCFFLWNWRRVVVTTLPAPTGSSLTAGAAATEAKLMAAVAKWWWQGRKERKKKRRKKKKWWIFIEHLSMTCGCYVGPIFFSQRNIFSPFSCVTYYANEKTWEQTTRSEIVQILSKLKSFCKFYQIFSIKPNLWPDLIYSISGNGLQCSTRIVLNCPQTILKSLH